MIRDLFDPILRLFFGPFYFPFFDPNVIENDLEVRLKDLFIGLFYLASLLIQIITLYLVENPEEQRVTEVLLNTVYLNAAFGFIVLKLYSYISSF